MPWRGRSRWLSSDAVTSGPIRETLRGPSRAELVGLVDLDETARKRLGDELGVPAAATFAELVASLESAGKPLPEAVSVATPTVTHEEVVLFCLERGLHVLVEKPIAHSVPAAERMNSAAREAGRVLAVGHVERFSPAFQAARHELAAPRYVEAHRLAPFVPRSLDVDVVLDLMIHDLDLTLALVPSEVEAVDAAGVPVLTDGADIATARIRFRDGTIANLTASRVSRDKVRKIRFFGRGRYHSLDLLRGEGERVLLSQSSPGAFSLPPDLPPALAPTPLPPGTDVDAAAALPPSLSEAQGLELLAYLQHAGLSLQYGKVEVTSRNALRDELADFLAAVARSGDAAVSGADARTGAPDSTHAPDAANGLRGASGEDGMRALLLAEEVRRGVHDSLERLRSGS
ncbi:MAG: Gfo/Idh/MocA family oxidoreductase [Candidatus Eisenbacteria bacterium]